MRVYLKTLGCRLNEAELEVWAEGFIQRGHALVQNPEEADLLVINTCAVTSEAVKKSRKIIRRIQRNNPTAKLVISGCYASLDKNPQQLLPGVDLLVHNRDKDKLVEITLSQLDIQTMPTLATEPGEAALFQRGRNRAFIKIQDGCRYRCTFCIVTVARGNERSRRETDIINDINRLHRQGVREVVLTGVHVGGYGGDIRSSLYRLLGRILSETDIPRIRLASLEPWDLPDDFFALFSNRRLMPHLHLPLQSGSDSVLRRMARRCKKDDFRNLIRQARSEIDDFSLTSDIIVGFPGETDAEWRESLQFINEIGFSRLHIFTYSSRDGTKAATLENQINPKIKKQRSRELYELARSMRFNFLGRQLGKTHHILWETQNADNKWTGYTENFIRVELRDEQKPCLENHISRAKITAIGHNADHCCAALL